MFMIAGAHLNKLTIGWLVVKSCVCMILLNLLYSIVLYCNTLYKRMFNSITSWMLCCIKCLLRCGDFTAICCATLCWLWFSKSWLKLTVMSLRGPIQSNMKANETVYFMFEAFDQLIMTVSPKCLAVLCGLEAELGFVVLREPQEA